MKKLFGLVFIALLLFAGTSYAGDSTDKDATKFVAEKVETIKVEQKESLKIDDAEYTGAVASKSNLWALGGILGMASLALFGTVKGGDDDSDELKAIKEIGGQLDGFKKTLGDKLDKSEFGTLTNELKALKDGLKDWSGEKIENSMKTINDGIAKMAKQIEEMQEDVAKTKDGASKRAKASQFVDAADIQKFIDSTFKDGRKTSENASIKLNGGLIFTNKAAETFGIPTFFEGASGTETDAFTGRFIDPTLYQRKRKRNLILDHFPIETITVPKLIYLEKKEISGDVGSSTDTGGADWITSGESKPPRSFRVTTGSVEAKKVAIFGTVEDKLLRDVPSLDNWIREDFRDEIMEEYNDGLLNNNPAVDEDAPLGLKQNAIQFDASPAFDGVIASPNYVDMIVAVAAYMATLKEKPSKVFVADDVFYAIMILKDGEGRYQNNTLVYVNALGQLFIGGVQVVPADDEDVPSTHILAISESVGFKIKNYGPLVFERGLNGTDFKEDKTSYRGYQEVLSYIPEHRYNSVLYDTWANVEAGITAGS